MLSIQEINSYINYHLNGAVRLRQQGYDVKFVSAIYIQNYDYKKQEMELDGYEEDYLQILNFICFSAIFKKKAQPNSSSG